MRSECLHIQSASVTGSYPGWIAVRPKWVVSQDSVRGARFCGAFQAASLLRFLQLIAGDDSAKWLWNYERTSWLHDACRRKSAERQYDHCRIRQRHGGNYLVADDYGDGKWQCKRNHRSGHCEWIRFRCFEHVPPYNSCFRTKRDNDR